MSIPEQPPELSGEPTAQQVEDILSSPELVRAVENDDFKVFLDHIPVGIAVARNGDGPHRIVYANQAFESLSGLPLEAMKGSGWSVLDGFSSEDDGSRTLGAAITAGEDFLGTFRKGPDGQAARTVQGYVGVIENEDGTENYRIAALVDVTERERSLKRGDPVDFDRLAGRIDALAALYQALEVEPNAQQVDLGGYLSQIASTVARAQSDGSIALELKVSFCPASVNVALPAGLLLNELLTNSLKYAFVGRDKGTVVLECSRLDDDRYRIVVADDGVGLPPGMGWPLPGKLSALILQTLRENTKQTEFNVETVPDGGTRVRIEFVHHAPAPKAN